MEEGKNFNYDDSEKKFHHGIDHAPIADISIFRLIVKWQDFTQNGFDKKTEKLMLTTMKKAIEIRIEIHKKMKK